MHYGDCTVDTRIIIGAWYRLELNSMIPQTFRLDVAAEKAEFEEIYKGQSFFSW